MIRFVRPGLWLACLLLAAAVPATLPLASQPAATATATTAPATQVAGPASAYRPPPVLHAATMPTTARAELDLSSIATLSEEINIRLDQTEADATSDRLTQRVQAELPDLATEIVFRLAESNGLLQSTPTLSSLTALEQDWSTINMQLADWKSRLDKRQKFLIDERNQLLSKTESGKLIGTGEPWLQSRDTAAFYEDRTRDPVLKKTLTAQRETIDEVIQKIDHVQDVLGAQSRAVFQLRTDLDLQLARTMGALNSVRRDRELQLERLFHPDGVGVWQLRGWTDDTLMRQGRASFRRQFRAVAVYIRRRRDQVAFQAGVAVLLAVGLFWARRIVRRWAQDDPNVAAAKPAFASPIATALVLSFVVGVWIYPQAPRLFWAGVGAMALVPTVVILRGLIERRLFAVLDALVVFYFVDQLREVLAAIPLVARVLFLAEMTAAAGMLLSLVLSNRRSTETSRFATVIRFGFRIWFGVLAGVVLANAVGYVSLSELVGSAALDGAYLAVIFYACTLVISGLVVIGMRSRPFVLLQMVKRFQPLLLRRAMVTLQWIALAGWVVAMLELLSARQAAFTFLDAVWNKQIGIGSLRFAPMHLIGFCFAVWASFLVSRFIRFVLCEDVYDRFPMPGGLSYAINRMVHYFVLLGGFYLGIAALGMDMSQFTFLSAAFGLGIGFGMQNIFNNFVSGLILLFERPIKVGDVIQLDDTSGVVNHIGIRASIIRTIDSSEIIVPNGNLISSRVTNWTLSNRQRGITIPVAVGGTNPTGVMELLVRVAQENPLVTKLPKPQAFLIKFGQDSFSYELHAWTDVAEQWVQIRSDLSVAINAELVKQNIPIR